VSGNDKLNDYAGMGEMESDTKTHEITFARDNCSAPRVEQLERGTVTATDSLNKAPTEGSPTEGSSIVQPPREAGNSLVMTDMFIGVPLVADYVPSSKDETVPKAKVTDYLPQDYLQPETLSTRRATDDPLDGVTKVF
jgi:hypothetical protein